MIKRKTAKSRLKRALQALSDWCRMNRHQPIPVQHQTLKQKLQGHYAYYGITGNFLSLQEFREEARKIWKRWLSRRRRGRSMSWTDFLTSGATLRFPRPAWSTACSVAQRSHEMTSQMRVICTSGSVGAPGEQSPGATRPAKPSAAVWEDVHHLLSEPERVRAEYERRLQGPETGPERRGEAS